METTFVIKGLLFEFKNVPDEITTSCKIDELETTLKVSNATEYYAAMKALVGSIKEVMTTQF